MAQCIFCKSTDGPFRTREHILPESLGGGEWAVLPAGLYCDSCQNIFGSAIEQQALADYPFSFLRIFLSVPTKKGKMPWLQSWEGRVQAAGAAGLFHLDPSPDFKDSFDNGTKTEMRLLAEPRKTDMVCRTLLKMGLEVVAADNPSDALSSKFDAARNYALLGRKESSWWYLQAEDMDRFSRLLAGVPLTEDVNGMVKLETCDVGDDAEVFHLRLFHLDMLCPLEARIMPPSMDDLPAPHHRLFVI